MGRLNEFVHRIHYKRLIKSYGKRTEKQRRKCDEANDTVVLVKLDGIGDFVLFLDAAKGLRKFYEGKRLLLCCSRAVESIARLTGCFDEVYCFEREDFFAENLAHTYKRIRELRCDILLHPTQPRHIFAEILCYLIDARKKIASLGELGGISKQIKDECDTIYDMFIDQGIDNMSLVQSAIFLRGLGYTDYKAHLPKLENVKQYNLCLPKDYFVLFIGGSIYNKLWDPNGYKTIAEYIQKETGWDCVLCGDRFDREQEDILEYAGFTNYYSYIGRTCSIDEVCYIISKSHAVVGNDTSAIHIANALNIPSVCVAGRFANKKFYPYTPEVSEADRVVPMAVCHDVPCSGCTMHNANYECIDGDYFSRKKIKCISEITCDEVLEQVKLMLVGMQGRSFR